MSRPWGQPNAKAAARGTEAEGCGAAEVFDCGCRYAIAEGWAPCALHAHADELFDAVRDLAGILADYLHYADDMRKIGRGYSTVDTSGRVDVNVLAGARVLLDRIDRGWRHA